jgi:hypothetical protein
VKLILAIACCVVVSAQTLIVDRIYSPLNNTLYEGRIQITAPDMTHLGKTYVRSTREYVVTAGNFAASLIPNDAATPAGTSYSVRFVPNSGSPWTQTWVIPTSASPLKINQVRVNTPPSTSLLVLLQQLSTEGATEGSCLKFSGGAIRWVSDCGTTLSPAGKTWAQLTTFTWASISTTTWSQLQ